MHKKLYTYSAAATSSAFFLAAASSSALLSTTTAAAGVFSSLEVGNGSSIFGVGFTVEAGGPPFAIQPLHFADGPFFHWLALYSTFWRSLLQLEHDRETIILVVGEQKE